MLWKDRETGEQDGDKKKKLLIHYSVELVVIDVGETGSRRTVWN